MPETKSMIRKKLTMWDFALAAGVSFEMVQSYTVLLRENFPELRFKRKQLFISDL